jgi:hypothetical protein
MVDTIMVQILNDVFKLFDAYIECNQEFIRKFINIKLLINNCLNTNESLNLDASMPIHNLKELDKLITLVVSNNKTSYSRPLSPQHDISGEKNDEEIVDNTTTFFQPYLDDDLDIKPDLKNDCQLCGRSFHFLTHLKRHMQNHETDTMFPCYFCAQQFTNRPNLSKHMRIHVQADNTYKCNNCEQAFDLFKDLKAHVITSHANFKEKYICKICKKTFIILKNYRAHLKMHKD